MASSRALLWVAQSRHDHTIHTATTARTTVLTRMDLAAKGYGTAILGYPPASAPFDLGDCSLLVMPPIRLGRVASPRGCSNSRSGNRPLPEILPERFPPPELQ